MMVPVAAGRIPAGSKRIRRPNRSFVGGKEPDEACGPGALGTISRRRVFEQGSYTAGYKQRRAIMSLGTILLIILILILLGALPTWPYSSGWGYYPSGGIGLILVIVLILVLLGRI